MLRIIASAAYVEQELSAEFGKLPPAFLPIGVCRLYEVQAELFGRGCPLFLTIPDGFSPLPFDQRRLVELGVTLVPVPVGLKLGESIIHAVNSIGAPSGPLQLLHGDTLIEDLPEGTDDLIAVQGGGADYSWAAVELDGQRVIQLNQVAAGTMAEESTPVACGYFAFSSSTRLVRALTLARGDFIAGLNLYSCDLPLTAAPVRQWRDFGHVQTYFRSRHAITTARSFNALRIDACKVRKSSRDRAKIAAEAAWLAGVPACVQPFSARFLGAGDDAETAYYDTEYHYAPTLSELLVFSSIGRATWRHILRSCREFLEICATCKGPGCGTAALATLTSEKTNARLDQFATMSGFDIGRPTMIDGRKLPSLLRIADELADYADLTAERPECVMHGDFCFSNIMYNSRSARITVIDPRGYVQAGESSIFGDTRYDLAKLLHSVYGCYDHIMAGRYVLRQDNSHALSISFDIDPNHQWLQREVTEMVIDGVAAGSVSVRAVMVGLFLSMLPLHADRPDRQTAFIANALRLYRGLLDGLP